MTQFNPKKNEKTAEEWLAIADDTNNESGQFSHFSTGGGIVFGLLAFAVTANPVFGISVTAYCLYSGWQKRQATNRSTIAIRDYHMAAPFLKGDHFRDFLAQVGDEKLMEEIKWAVERGFQVSNDALDFYEAGIVTPTATVGANTKLNAITVPAAPVTDSRAIAQSDTPRPHAPSIQDLRALPLQKRAEAVVAQLEADGFDLARCVQTQISCICGNQRGGKGTLMAILAILSKASDPNTQIHYFTAGDDVYPFKCDRLICRLSYPKLFGIF